MDIKRNINLKELRILLIIILISSNSIFANSEISNDADSTNVHNKPNIHLTFEWLLIQMIPSPEWVKNNDKFSFGMQWQITPLLYSFGINKNVNPWRSFIIDPVKRQSGSAEFFLSPEYLNLASSFKNKWLFRTGVRLYFPLWHRGEYLSYSISSSYFNFNGQNGISYEAGIYMFAGILGFQTTYSPAFKNSEWIFTFRIRYF
ncbi:MAG: hypothetical protein HND52_12610 [Ignavibacteriae bacterium]|nr:hypothetical protein [Ignavibacteriota bacterium]NOG98793.1 hypothetical protein [Ignavibacteriota bacterium]